MGELFNSFNPIDVRKKLFYFDENKRDTVVKCNPYLKSDISYYEAREKLKKLKIKFITGDIFKISIDETFDNIWLSNIGTYLSRHFVKKMVDKISNNLNDGGKLLISYLYKTTIDTKYEDGNCLIYDLDRTFDILKEYSPDLISFIGVDGIKTYDDNIKDSVLIYKK